MKHGRITLKDGQFVIEAPPHVSIRLRRLFGGAQRYRAGVFTLAATPEHAHDLEWFCTRHPLEMEPSAVARFRELVETQNRKLAAIEAIDTEGYIPTEFALAIPPREYQRMDADLALKTGGLLIASQLGTGKTISGICALAAPGVLPAVVVTMTHLTRQWERELARFAPKLRVHRIRSTQPYAFTDVKLEVDPLTKRRKVVRHTTTPDVLLISYSKLHGWADVLARLCRTMISDECVTADTLVSMETGPSTPICNLSPGDLVSSFDGEGRVTSDVVEGVVRRGRRPVWKVRLVDGRQLRCTDNERLWTDRGWMFLSEVINETSASDESMEGRAPIRIGTQPDPGKHARGRQHELAIWPGQSKAQVRALHATGRILPPQGGRAEELREDSAEVDGESGMGRNNRDVLDRDCTGAGIPGADLFPRREWQADQGGNRGVGVHADLGSGRVLVHGRRSSQPSWQLGIDLDARVLRTGGAEIGSVSRGWWGGGVRGEGVPSTTEPYLLADPNEEIRRGVSDGSCSSVYPSVDGLQGSGESPTGSDSVPVVWNCLSPAVPVEHLLSEDGVQDGQESSLSSRVAFSEIASIEPDGVEEVWDLETKKHHAFFANGFAVHNCQEFRRPDTRKYNAGKAIAQAMDMRIGLSASPVYNYGHEIFHVMEIIAPGQLGTWKEFLDEWCGGSVDGNGRATVYDPAALGSYLRSAGLMVRRTRKEIGREIPDLTIVRHACECDESSINRVAADVAELARRVLDRIGTGIERMQDARDIDYQMREATGIGKAAAVAALVRMLVDSGEQVLLSGWHRAVYDIWQSDLDREGARIPYAMYTGTESDTQKDEARRRFMSGEARVMIISNRSGAGLDGLQTCCSVVVVGELDWSPQVIHQLIGRVHRDGQTNKVVAYMPVADCGSDPVIARVLGIKEAQSHYLLNPGSDGMPEFHGAGDDHIRMLAEDVLKRRGHAVDN